MQSPQLQTWTRGNWSLVKGHVSDSNPWNPDTITGFIISPHQITGVAPPVHQPGCTRSPIRLLTFSENPCASSSYLCSLPFSVSCSQPFYSPIYMCTHRTVLQRMQTTRRTQTLPVSNRSMPSTCRCHPTLSSAMSVSSAGISEEWQLNPTDPRSIAYPIRLALVGWYLTMPILQAGSLATFSSRTSLLARPTPVSSGMHRVFHPPTSCFPTLHPSHPYSWHKRLLNCPEKVISGVVLFGLALMEQSFHWRYSRISRTGGFELCRRVRPLLVFFFHFPPLFFFFFSLYPTERANE